MKNIIASLLVGVILLPATQVRKEETDRGVNELLGIVQTKIVIASDNNKSHIFVDTSRYNFAQKYGVQQELQKKGYDFDFSLFGKTYVGW